MAEARRSPQAPASGRRFLFGSCNLVGSGRGMAVIDVMGRTRTGRFDRVIPTVGLVQVGQVRPKRSYMPWLGSVTKATRCPSRVDFANSFASEPQQPTAEFYRGRVAG